MSNGHRNLPRPFRAVVLLITIAAIPVSTTRICAIEPPILMREAENSTVNPALQGCPLEPNLTGDCSNLRYYNLCSGYLWIYSFGNPGEAIGVRFDAPCVGVGSSVTRAITYWRNVVPNYGNTIDAYLDADPDNDGCPDYVLAQDLDVDPGLRWNCHEMGALCLPSGLAAAIVRTVHDGGAAPSIATDGPFADGCDPLGTPHSYYYGVGTTVCLPWGGMGDRDDNFLYWLILNQGCPTPTTSRSWGAIKGLYR